MLYEVITVAAVAGQLPERLVKEILEADQTEESGIRAQRAHVAELKSLIGSNDDLLSKRLVEIADTLVERVIWIIGGDSYNFV